MVHTPIPIPQAMKIPKARDAVQAEWDKLVRKKAWDVTTVRPRQSVIDEANKENTKVHFGSLMDLCHEKHSELNHGKPSDQRTYKGQVVFRGDQVRDETGYYAVFSEQGSSASHMAAGKFLDAISHFPGMSGSDSDAVGAYTQAVSYTHLTLPTNRCV